MKNQTATNMRAMLAKKSLANLTSVLNRDTEITTEASDTRFGYIGTDNMTDEQLLAHHIELDTAITLVEHVLVYGIKDIDTIAKQLQHIADQINNDTLDDNTCIAEQYRIIINSLRALALKTMGYHI